MANARIVVWIVVLAVLSAASVSWGGAKTVEYNSTHCYGGDAKFVRFSEDHWAMSYELVGTLTPRDVRTDLISTHCVGAGVFDKGTFTIDTNCEFADKDGDKYYGTGRRVGPKGEWTFVAGTGKYEGITGGGTYTPTGRFPTIAPGKFQGCMHSEGSYTLPE